MGTVRWGEVFLAFLLFFLSQLVLGSFFITLLGRLQTGQWEHLDKWAQDPFWEGVIQVLGLSATFFLLVLYLLTLPSTTKCQIINPAQKDVNFFWLSLGKGLLWWFLAIPFVLVTNLAIALSIQWLHPHTPLEQHVVQRLQTYTAFPLLLLAMGVLICTVVPVLEEILFRGFLQTRLRQSWNAKGAILLSSLIFSLFHFSLLQKWENFELLSSIFVLSLFLGHLYEREGTLLAPIGLHASFNAITFLVIPK